jgi:hypothetical protein
VVDGTLPNPQMFPTKDERCVSRPPQKFSRTINPDYTHRGINEAIACASMLFRFRGDRLHSTRRVVGVAARAVLSWFSTYSRRFLNRAATAIFELQLSPAFLEVYHKIFFEAGLTRFKMITRNLRATRTSPGLGQHHRSVPRGQTTEVSSRKQDGNNRPTLHVAACDVPRQ